MSDPEEQHVRGIPSNIGGLFVFALMLGVIILALFLAQNDNWQPQAQVTPEATSTQEVVNNNSTAVATGESSVAVLTATPTETAVSNHTSTPSPSATPFFTVTLTAEEIASRTEPECQLPPSSWEMYTVQAGDTVSSLAVSSGATIAEVNQVNCITMNSIYAGKTIYLPTTPPVRQICGPPASWVLYTVQQGDTLYSISNQLNTQIYEILQANCLVSVSITAGRQIYLPTLINPPTAVPSNTPLPPPTNTPPPPTTIVTVVVTATPEPTQANTATAVPATATNTATIPPVTATFTATPAATVAPTATPTETSVPVVTATPTAIPTETSIPATETPVATPTETSVPPAATETPTIAPTETSIPATETPVATPTP